MYFDDAARQDGTGARVVVISLKKHILSYLSALTQLCSNDMAEYQALILGLQMAVEISIKDLDVYGDSQLATNQLLEEYKIKKKDLIPYHTQALQILDKLDTIKLEYIPRSTNKMADALINLAATLALGAEEDMTIPVCGKWVVTQSEDEFAQGLNAVYAYEVEKEDWHHPLIDYLKHGKLPKDARYKTEISTFSL